LVAAHSRTGLTLSGSGFLTSGAALLGGANDQVGEIVTEPRRRLAVITTAGRFAPAASFRRSGAQERVKLRVNVAIRVHVIVRPH
jgi:hypothetical protein